MSKILRITGASLFFALLVFAVIVAFNHEQANRLYGTMTLFDEDKIVHNFSHMDEVFLSNPVKRSGPVFTFGSAPSDLPDSFAYKGTTLTTDEFLNRRATTALLVIKDDKINFEQYYQGTNENDLRISWSMAKSFTVTLFGIAVHDGLIDIDAPVEKYLPEMTGTGYAGVPVRDVLQMSSGVLWNEDYGD
ncbi:MAG: serine hydrolase, partial [Emcibacter sp.]|nr:serine hydrolase [Emcibacter sp.]